jgi:hypothetical protein
MAHDLLDCLEVLGHGPARGGEFHNLSFCLFEPDKILFYQSSRN